MIRQLARVEGIACRATRGWAHARAPLQSQHHGLGHWPSVSRAAGASAVHTQSRAPSLPRHRSALSSASSTDTFHRLADFTLETILEVYDERADNDPQLAMDVEYAVALPARTSVHCLHHPATDRDASSRARVAQDGVLNVVVGEHGTFVLNKQTPNQQIWLSSPISGPLRYDFSHDARAWINSRDGHELLPLLADDFEKLTGSDEPLVFDAVADGLAEM